jgi:hypothetical protein
VIDVDPRAEQVQLLAERLAAGVPPTRLLDLGEDRELVSLAVLSRHLEAALPAAPAPAFRARLQAQLQTELADSHVRAARPPLWARWLPRLAAATMALIIVSATAVAASAASLPGDALYPVKRAAENVRLLLSWGPAAAAAIQMDIAAARLAELRALQERGAGTDPALVAAVVAAHDAARAAASQSDDPALQAQVEARIAADNQALSPPNVGETVAEPEREPEEQPAAGVLAATATDVVPAVTAVASEVPSPLPLGPSSAPQTLAPTPLPTEVPPTAAPPPAVEEPGSRGPAPATAEPPPVNTEAPTAEPPATNTLVPNWYATDRAMHPPATWTPRPSRTPWPRPSRRSHDVPTPVSTPAPPSPAAPGPSETP